MDLEGVLRWAYARKLHLRVWWYQRNPDHIVFIRKAKIDHCSGFMKADFPW